MKKVKQTILIGLDGATFSIINPMLKKGELPNISGIINNGYSAVLEAAFPPSTFPGWPTIATGKNPGKHGIYGFFNPESRKPLSSRRIRTVDIKYINTKVNNTKNLWNFSDELKIGFVNFPSTFPVRRVNGFMVGGVLAPSPKSKRFTYPENLKCIHDGYEIDAKFLANPKEALDNVNRVLDKRMKAIEELDMKYNPELLCFVLTGVDRISHYLWGKKEVQKHYKKVDKLMGKFLSNKDDYNLFLVSDHGFQANNFQFNVNTWLKKNKLLSIKKESGILNSLFRKIGLNTKNVIRMIKLLHMEFILQKLPLKIRGIFPEKDASFEDAVIDWKKTYAYSTFTMESRIYINLKGREPYGSVDEKDYENVREDIIKRINKIDKKISAVKREDEYSGKYTSLFPDIIVRVNKPGYQAHTCLSDKVFSKVDHSRLETPLGRHHKDGIFVAYGSDIAKGKSDRFYQWDVMPTILHCLGKPIPKDLDGRVLHEVFKKNSEPHNRKIKYISPKEKIRDVASKIKI